MIPSPPCILCGTDRFHTILIKDSWHYRECCNCRLVALHPRPTLQTLMHSYDAYLPEDSPAIAQWAKLVKPVINVSAELITARTQNCGRLLDVGCGYGFFMERMGRAGWSVEGIEVSPTGRRYARQRWGFDVHARPLEELNLPQDLYDVVTLFYVIEHVDDPIKVLNTVKRILKPGGLILLRWPHTTPIVKLLGPWAHRLDLYHTPYHLYDFSPANMTRLLKVTGFRGIETVIGGYTHPHHRLSRGATTFFGRLAQALFAVSQGRWLLPGVSKTTLARR